MCLWKIRQFPNGFTVVDVISLLDSERKGISKPFFCLRAVCVCVSCYHRKWRCSRGRCRRATFTFLKQPRAVNRLRDPSELTGGGISLISDGFFSLKTRFSTEKNKFQRHIFMKIHRYIGHKIQRVTFFFVFTKYSFCFLIFIENSHTHTHKIQRHLNCQ